MLTKGWCGAQGNVRNNYPVDPLNRSRKAEESTEKAQKSAEAVGYKIKNKNANCGEKKTLGMSSY